MTSYTWITNDFTHLGFSQTQKTALTKCLEDKEFHPEINSDNCVLLGSPLQLVFDIRTAQKRHDTRLTPEMIRLRHIQQTATEQLVQVCLPHLKSQGPFELGF